MRINTYISKKKKSFVLGIQLVNYIFPILGTQLYICIRAPVRVVFLQCDKLRLNLQIVL